MPREIAPYWENPIFFPIPGFDLRAPSMCRPHPRSFMAKYLLTFSFYNFSNLAETIA